MTRQVAIGLGVMGAMLLGSLFYLYDVTEMVRRTSELDETETGFPDLEEPLYEPTDPPREVRIFFPGPDNDLLLRTRRMTIYESSELTKQARQIIDLLIEGSPNSNLYAGLPEGTALNQLFVSGDGIAYVDFNNALADNHPGGILPEQATVYSIVNSLVYNLDGIDRVKILIGGTEKETLAGHCLLLLPLETDLAITDFQYQAEEDAGPDIQVP